MADLVYVLPDPVLAVIQYLRARPEVTALAASGNILTALPPTLSGLYVLVSAAGGVGIWPSVEDAVIQVDAYGGTKDQCSLLARTVRAAIWGIRNDTVAVGVLVHGSEEIGPQWMPDSSPKIPQSRFVARYRVLLHP